MLLNNYTESVGFLKVGLYRIYFVHIGHYVCEPIFYPVTEMGIAQ